MVWIVCLSASLARSLVATIAASELSSTGFHCYAWRHCLQYRPHPSRPGLVWFGFIHLPRPLPFTVCAGYNYLANSRWSLGYASYMRKEIPLFATISLTIINTFRDPFHFIFLLLCSQYETKAWNMTHIPPLWYVKAVLSILYAWEVSNASDGLLGLLWLLLTP